jgi:sec-independent protein translocase protein TatC
MADGDEDSGSDPPADRTDDEAVDAPAESPDSEAADGESTTPAGDEAEETPDDPDGEDGAPENSSDGAEDSGSDESPTERVDPGPDRDRDPRQAAMEGPPSDIRGPSGGSDESEPDPDRHETAASEAPDGMTRDEIMDSIPEEAPKTPMMDNPDQFLPDEAKKRMEEAEQAAAGADETADGSEVDTAETTPDGAAAADVAPGPEATEAETGEPALNEEPRPRDGPMEDEEMPLTAHIEELLKRLAIVMVIAGLTSLAVFPFGEEIINLLWESALPGANARPRLYGPLELLLTQIKVASLGGVLIALPALVYQSYRFMRPGLYPHERRYYLAAVPTSLVLAFVGVSFAYFVVLPAIFTYFLRYTEETAQIAFALGRTFNLILILMGYLAVVFQIPLFIMLAIMMGLVTRQWLADRRLLFWGGFLGISVLFTPDPTGMSPIILAVTMIALFEGTLFLVKWVRRGRERYASDPAGE